MKKLLILGLLLLIATEANAGIFSKVRNWANTGWDNYDYGQNCPCHRPYNHHNRFFNNGAITGFTPPIINNGTNYSHPHPSIGNYHSPMYGRFDHLPDGAIPQMNTPTRRITDFNTNVGTRTGVTILD